MAVLSVYILNKAGGLIYQRDFRQGLNKLAVNEYLVIAGTLHSVHALTSRVAPNGTSSGLQTMETAKYTLHCFQTVTGIKFIVLTDVGQYNPDGVINKVYQIFSDHVMKNPFYQLDMPVRCDQFDRHLSSYLASVA